MFTQSQVQVLGMPRRREVNTYEARAGQRCTVEWKPMVKCEPERTVKWLRGSQVVGKLAGSSEAQYLRTRLKSADHAILRIIS